MSDTLSCKLLILFQDQAKCQHFIAYHNFAGSSPLGIFLKLHDTHQTYFTAQLHCTKAKYRVWAKTQIVHKHCGCAPGVGMCAHTQCNQWDRRMWQCCVAATQTTVQQVFFFLQLLFLLIPQGKTASGSRDTWPHSSHLQWMVLQRLHGVQLCDMQLTQTVLSSRLSQFHHHKASPVLQRCGRTVLFLCVSSRVLQSRDLLGEEEFLPQKEKKYCINENLTAL